MVPCGGAQDTIYLCNFRVSVDGEWLCLKELHDVEIGTGDTTAPSTPSPVDPPLLIARDPVIIERRNLVNISKLIVKELIETSLKYGRMLDSDHMPLQHFFIVLEHVLRHGLRPKKGLLGPKKELWDILQMVEKLNIEAQDITSSVRELPTVRTQMGRARAWLRIALMQKKLADYLKLLIDHRDDILVEYFEPDALMMSDEAIIIVGLLVGLNVIDCNLCVKEEDLDCQQGVIDFSLYLRSSHHTSVGESPEDDLDLDNMTTVLDQKNYIEELNRHLNATVANLQAKVESLTTTNALMKEDLAIAKKNLMSVMDENNFLKSHKKRDINSERKDEGGGEKDIEIEKLKKELEAEKKLRSEAEQELSLQVSLKAEMEMAMKLLEKDIHDKQDTIVSLRKQLNDIKTINLDMYKKLQECEEELTEKGQMVSRLQAKTLQIGQLLENLQKFYYLSRQKDEDEGKLAIEEARVKATETSAELMAEKEVRKTLQGLADSDREKIFSLQQEVTQLKVISEKYVNLQEEHFRLIAKCKEQEETLEELGRHFSSYKLQVVEMKEAELESIGGGTSSRRDSMSSSTGGVTPWTDDKAATQCKHHCRNCGEIFCKSCSNNAITVPSSASSKPVRVCDDCYFQLLASCSVIH
ncbi:hypothetical protein AAG570_002274 [Ranatra chinensis]|uniref:RUN and FYVE domain-containing protein 2 n=1 Tax=Ranatra chinensis TaxID=642074 RepID=A0ABD0YL75_9HEMI